MSKDPSPMRRAGLFGLMAAAFTPLLQACSPLRIINALAPASTYTRSSDQVYGPNPRQKIDVYQPNPPVPDAPVVVFFYGGSWTTGDRADYLFAGEALASRGIVTLIADYRLSPEVRYPVFVQDSALAVKWAFDNAKRFGGDPKKLFVMGHSAGGYNAAMVALDARWLDAVGMRPAQLAGFIGIAGAYDFLPIAIPDVQVAFSWPNTPPDSQPLFHASRAAPRTLLLAARNDTLVNAVRNTEGLSKKLRDAGVPVQTEILDGVSHVTIIGSLAKPLRLLAPVLDRVAEFVKPGKAA
jgi:acetyl esterase/lipase